MLYVASTFWTPTSSRQNSIRSRQTQAQPSQWQTTVSTAALEISVAGLLCDRIGISLAPTGLYKSRQREGVFIELASSCLLAVPGTRAAVATVV